MKKQVFLSTTSSTSGLPNFNFRPKLLLNFFATAVLYCGMSGIVVYQLLEKNLIQLFIVAALIATSFVTSFVLPQSALPLSLLIIALVLAGANVLALRGLLWHHVTWWIAGAAIIAVPIVASMIPLPVDLEFPGYGGVGMGVMSIGVFIAFFAKK